MKKSLEKYVKQDIPVENSIGQKQITNRILRKSECSAFIAKHLNKIESTDLISDLRIIIEDSQYANVYRKMENVAGASQEAMEKLQAVCYIWREEFVKAKKIKYNPHKKTLIRIKEMKNDTEKFILFLVDKYWSFLGSAVKKINKKTKKK
jgi:hypothetical protein